MPSLCININYHDLCFLWEYLLLLVVVDATHTSDDVISGSKITEGFIPIIDPAGPSTVFVVISLK